MDDAFEGGRGVHPEARRDGGGRQTFVGGFGIEVSVGPPAGEDDVVRWGEVEFGKGSCVVQEETQANVRGCWLLIDENFVKSVVDE